jgi:hypothetical protein
MTTLTSITRTQISNIASLAHGPFLLHLDHHDRIRILSSLASIYSCLGFRRKEVFILREVQATLMDLLLSAKDETQASAHWNALSSVNRKSSVTEEDDDGADGNESMLRMAKYICEVYGLDLTLVKLVKEDKAVAAEVDVDAGDVQSLAAKDALQLPFGWPELQVGVAREAIAITESLPSTCRQSRSFHADLMLSRRLSKCRSVLASGSEVTSYIPDTFRAVPSICEFCTGARGSYAIRRSASC